MTSCHVSEKPKNGPVIAQTMIVTTARTHARPTSREVIWAISEKSLLTGGHPLTQSMALTCLWPDPFAFGLLPFAMCVCSRWTGRSKECSMQRKVPWCLGSNKFFLQGSKTRIGLCVRIVRL
jgi:hypothetical protein